LYKLTVWVDHEKDNPIKTVYTKEELHQLQDILMTAGYEVSVKSITPIYKCK